MKKAILLFFLSIFIFLHFYGVGDELAHTKKRSATSPSLLRRDISDSRIIDQGKRRHTDPDFSLRVTSPELNPHFAESVREGALSPFQFEVFMDPENVDKALLCAAQLGDHKFVLATLQQGANPLSLVREDGTIRCAPQNKEMLQLYIELYNSGLESTHIYNIVSDAHGDLRNVQKFLLLKNKMNSAEKAFTIFSDVLGCSFDALKDYVEKYCVEDYVI